MLLRNLFLIASLLSAPAFAASSDTLLLQGTVNLVNDITINEVVGVNDSLDIVGGETNLTVANVDETSNNLTGYEITLSSANAGELRHGTDATKKTTYTVSYDGAGAVAPTASPQTVKTVTSLSGLATDTSPLNVNVVAYPTAPAGTYSDTLTLSIVANP